LKVGFFCQKTTEDSLVHFDIAKFLIQSVRESMPDVDIVQFTDDQSPEVKGVDDIHRIGGDLPMAIRRMTHHSRVSGEWLFVDTDVVIKKDVRKVFLDDFDIALTDREGTITNEHKYAQVMPYNIGVVFSRSPNFWKFVVDTLKTVPPNFQHWEGDQRVICEMMKLGLHRKYGFNVKIIPGRQYNYPPKSEDDTDASILHYKGNRKKYLFKESS